VKVQVLASAVPDVRGVDQRQPLPADGFQELLEVVLAAGSSSQSITISAQDLTNQPAAGLVTADAIRLRWVDC
jgi:hypothetical protein